MRRSAERLTVGAALARCRLAISPRVLLALGMLFVLAAPAAGQQGRLEPSDDAATDPSWIAFKSRLLDALARRDRQFVLSVLDPNVRNGPGARRGVAEFRRQWDLDGKDSALWRELPAALFLGGAYAKPAKGATEYCVPYVAVRWPQGVDRFAHGAITAKDALVKSAPSAAAPTLQALSYDIVRVLDWELPDESKDSPQKWVKIEVKAGAGFVPEEQIRSAAEHRACFSKAGGTWKMTALAAGE